MLKLIIGGFVFMDRKVDIKTWVVVGVAAFITFILVFFISNKLINGNKKVEDKGNDTTTTVEKYTVYNQGQEVNLKGGSSWNVLYSSSDDDEYLVLLSSDNVNSENVLYENINSFLNGSFKMSIVNALGCQSSDIQEVRLLAYLDLADISKANSGDFLPEKEMSEFNIPDFITKAATVTDTMYQTDDSSNPMMICKPDTQNTVDITRSSTNTSDAENNNNNETDKSDEVDNSKDSNNDSSNNTADNSQHENENAKKVDRFCLGDASKSLPVRAVLVISKKALGPSNASADGTAENNNSVAGTN